MRFLLAVAEVVLPFVLFLVMALVLSAALWPAAWLVRAAFAQGWAWGVLSLGPAYFAFGLALMALVVVIKWGFYFRARAGETPFFTWRAARWAVVTKFYDLARVLFVGHLRGSWLFTTYLRLLGAHVGQRSIINSAEISDWDLIHIGDDTLIGDGAVILGHTGEKGVLRMAPVHIGDGCTVGRDTVLFPGVTLEDGAVLAAMSVVPKGRTLPAGSMWGGTTLRQLRAAAPAKEER